MKPCVLINCFRLIKELDREIKDAEGSNPPEVNKQLNDEKQSMVDTHNFFFFVYIEKMQCFP